MSVRRRSRGGPTVRRTARLFTVGALALASLSLGPVTAAHAVAGPPVDASVTSGGAAATDVSRADSLVASVASPAEDTGSVAQTLDTSWDTGQLTADGTFTAPEGWALEYLVDGTWTSTTPTSPEDLALTSAVRAAGTTNSAGVLSGQQLALSSGGGELKSGGGSFQGSSGGDGWDVFFSGTKVLNVFHHNGSAYNLDCHYRTDGSSCNASVYSVSGYVTSGASTGSVVSGKVYSLVGHGTDAGVLCTDVSSTPFVSCGYTALVSGSFSGYDKLGRQTLVGTRIYAPVVNGANGSLVCFDAAANAACPGQPYALTGMSSTGSVPAFASAVSGKVFVTANKVWCFTASTGAACSGSWPVGSLSGSAAVAPMRTASLAVVGVCTIRPVGSCWDMTGAALTYPTGLAALLTTNPANSMGTWSDWAWTSRREYWVSSGTAFCYDWKTDAACAGFTGQSLDTDRYAVVIDPSDPACVWSNGDSGQIKTFDGLTGALGCPPPTDPTLQVAYSTAAPRLACSEDDRVAAWNSITLHTAGAIGTSDLRLTVKDATGDVVPGWQDVTPPNDGVVDLAALDVADTGSQPTFEVKAVGASDVDAQALTVDVAYTSKPAQLCVGLEVALDCPVLTAGVQNTGGVPVGAMTVTSTAGADSGSGPATSTAPTTITRADMTGCVGSIGGTVAVSPPGGDVPAPNQTVTLAPAAGGAAYATDTTDGSGNYAFPYVRPGSYKVTALGVDQTVTVTDVAADADVSVPVAAPVASPVTVTTLQATAGSAPVDVTVDDLATVDLDAVELQDPSDSSWGGTVAVAGEGTWTVLGNGSLRFTPLDAFTGTSSDVTYRAADSFGTTASSTAHAVVTAVRPSAHPVRSTGTQGSTQTITPDGRSRTLSIAPASVRVVDPETGLPETEVTVSGVGTFTADTVHGKVVLVPEGDFVGSFTVIYQVADVLGREAVSTITARTTQLDPSSTAVTVDSGVVANVPVLGAPVGSTVTGASSVAGKASAVTYARTRLTVTPVARYSGQIRVPFTVTNGTATFQRVATVSVRPLAPGSSTYKVGYGTTVVTWGRSHSTGVTGYEVWVDGHQVCRTTATTCTVDGVFGPKATVNVVAVGADGSKTRVATTGRYVPTAGCGGVSSVYFANDSAALAGDARAALADAAAVVKAQGFTKICLVGFTDANGSVAYNLALSKRRVDNVGTFLVPKVGRGVALTRNYRGKADPAAPNDTADGRALNRRVEIRVG